jgi:hypothetical protein
MPTQQASAPHYNMSTQLPGTLQTYDHTTSFRSPLQYVYSATRYSADLPPHNMLLLSTTICLLSYQVYCRPTTTQQASALHYNMSTQLPGILQTYHHTTSFCSPLQYVYSATRYTATNLPPHNMLLLSTSNYNMSSQLPGTLQTYDYTTSFCAPLQYVHSAAQYQVYCSQTYHHTTCFCSPLTTTICLLSYQVLCRPLTTQQTSAPHYNMSTQLLPQNKLLLPTTICLLSYCHTTSFCSPLQYVYLATSYTADLLPNNKLLLPCSATICLLCPFGDISLDYG